MQLARPAIALDPRAFGKGRPRELDSVRTAPTAIGDDLKLFVMTFAAGFLFVSILIS